MTRRSASLLLLIALTATGCATPPDRAGLDPAAPDPSALVAPDEMEQPTPGVVEVDGDDAARGYLPVAVEAFRATPAGRGRTVTLDVSGADRGLERLCRGEVDAVVSSRPLTASETALCRANRLGAATFRVAADATVAATSSGAGTDDCLTTEEVLEASAGVDDEATLALVAGTVTDREQALALPGLETDWDAAVASFKRERSWYRTAQGELGFARAEQRRGIAEDRPPPERAADDARVRRAEAEFDRARTAWLTSKAELGRVERLLAAARRSAQVVAGLDGTVGRFSLGFVTSAEPLLRPLPVATDDGDCVRPSAATVADGSYPLSEPLLVTVTDRALDRPEVEELVRFLLTDGDAPFEQAGLVTLPADVRAEQLGWLDDDAVPLVGTGPAEPERPAQ